MHKILSRSRALALVPAVLAVLMFGAACSSSDDESAETEPTPPAQATPDAESTPDAGSTTTPEDDEVEIPTVDIEAALEGIDTETPPPDGYCEASTYFSSDAFATEFNSFLQGGEDAAELGANIEEQMTNLVELAPPDLQEDAEAVTDAVTEYIAAVTEAVENDDFVDATALQERFAEVAESGERLAAYDEVVCGNPAPGSEGT